MMHFSVLRGSKSAAAVLTLLVSPAFVWSQSGNSESRTHTGQAGQDESPLSSGSTDRSASQSTAIAQPAPQTAASSPTPDPASTDRQADHTTHADYPDADHVDHADEQQTKRILGILPNFGAVSANTQLPPLTARQKFKLATEDSVDYSSFIWAGILAGQSLALNSYPELHGGAVGYGRYYWRGLVDQASGAMFTEAIVPALTHEDPRYYTLGHGGFFRRTGYALSRVVVTKTDSGRRTFNVSEVGGNGVEAALASLYYPPEERGARKIIENWGTGLESAALNNLVKEFWPDIRRHLLRQK